MIDFLEKAWALFGCIALFVLPVSLVGTLCSWAGLRYDHQLVQQHVTSGTHILTHSYHHSGFAIAAIAILLGMLWSFVVVFVGALSLLAWDA